jgi:predicted DNA-binding protein
MKKHDQQLSIRLPKTLLDELERASTELRETKSRFVKRSILAYLDFHNRVNRSVLEKRNK